MSVFDLVTMYKVVHGFDDTTGVFEFRVNSCTRGGELKIFTMFEHILLPVDMLTVGMNYLKLLVMLSH